MLEKARSISKYLLDAIKNIKQEIDTDPLRHKTTAELLYQESTPNRTSVEKAFKAMYGVGIKEYQVRQRMEVSKQFLEAGMTKKQVAGKCFYRSQSAYAAAFRKAFNMTPTEWQLLNA
jgi:AraC-like DNA-binding protein